ncbi:HlyD family secretion protein [Marinoscillum pacificum]|uniref:HlyD family secretion protein n=1 Tax=Marinoscillum pacificum TaxID=392723 RepID=UPI0021575E9A|nr:HlyD family secretion protein [Marinoscillum pacificum]
MPVNETQHFSERSEEVQEIIGTVPSWIIRWGISIIFVVLGFLIITSWFIKYPDVVKGEVLITTKEAPVNLISRNSGILKLLTLNGSKVDSGQVLGYLKNSGKLEDVLFVENTLRQKKQFGFIFENALEMGPVQAQFNKVVMSSVLLEDFRKNDRYQKEIDQITRQIKSLRELNENLTSQQEIFKMELSLINDKFAADSILFSDKVISLRDFKESKTSYLQQQRFFKAQESSIIDNEYEQIELQKRIDLLRIEKITAEASLFQQFESNVDELQGAIKNWKEEYLFIAPFDGELAFLDFLQENQFLNDGKPVFSVLPKNEELYARVIIPVYSSGKVFRGQEVNIKLDNYPSEEYGMLVGLINEVSTIPGVINDGETIYLISVDLPNGLQTTYQKKLPSKRNLTGEIEIITDDLRVIQRLFNWLRKLQQ